MLLQRVGLLLLEKELLDGVVEFPRQLNLRGV